MFMVEINQKMWYLLQNNTGRELKRLNKIVHELLKFGAKYIDVYYATRGILCMWEKKAHAKPSQENVIFFPRKEAHYQGMTELKRL